MTAGMLVFIISFILLSGAVISCALSARDDSALPEGDGSDIVIVVLGCRTREEPGTMLRKRLDAAYELLLRYPESAAVLCGGQGPNEPLSEAQSMYNYLYRRDVPPSRRIWKINRQIPSNFKTREIIVRRRASRRR